MSEALPAELIRRPIVEIIQKTYPDWSSKGFIDTLAALPKRRFDENFVFTHGKSVRRHYSHNFLNKIHHDKACEKIGLEIELYEATKHSFGTYYINHGASKDLPKEWFSHISKKSVELYAKIHVANVFRQREGGRSLASRPSATG